MKLDPRTGKPIVEISHSGLNSFSSCPKRFAFRKIITTMDSARESSDAADAGSALHEGLQEYMRTRDEDKAVEAIARHHQIELKDTDKASVYSLEAVIWSFYHCIRIGPADGGLNLQDYDLVSFVKEGVEYPATEIPFLVEIESEHLIFHQRAYIDFVLRHPYSGKYVVVDAKTTTKQAKANFHTKYKWDYQVTSYGIPLQALLGETGSFHVGIYGVILSDRDPVVHFPLFERKVSDIEDYQFYLTDKCRQIEHYWKLQRFPRNPSGCHSFGKPCFYINDCAAVTVNDMQNQINPSRQESESDVRGKPFEPVFTARMEA